MHVGDSPKPTRCFCSLVAAQQLTSGRYQLPDASSISPPLKQGWNPRGATDLLPDPPSAELGVYTRYRVYLRASTQGAGTLVVPSTQEKTLLFPPFCSRVSREEKGRPNGCSAVVSGWGRRSLMQERVDKP